MVDMNMVIADNILMCLKKRNRKQVDIADALGVSKQTVNKMLNGARVINAIELKEIADFFGVRMEELTKMPDSSTDMNIAHAFMGKVNSEQAKNALMIADKLSDMILFHSMIRENGMEMMKPWEKK